MRSACRQTVAMAIELRTATADDQADLFRVDGRSFGYVFSADEIAERAPTLEWDRFQLAVDGGQIVSAVAALTMQISLPGGRSVPMGGITWVSTAATHRRRGLMSTLIERAHRDAEDRGEAVTGLGASEAMIYGRFGYGVSTFSRRVEVAVRQVEFVGAGADGGVRFEHDEAALRAHVIPLWEAARATRPGEVSRNEAMWDAIFSVRRRHSDGASPAFWLLHADGYVSYRVTNEWDDGHAQNRVDVGDFVAVNDAARAALWRVLLSLDLVAKVTCAVAPDDPLPYWLSNFRAVRTKFVDDWVWLRPLDVARLFGARTYGSTDALVVQFGATSLQIAGSPDGAEVSSTDAAADLVVDTTAVGPLLMGGVSPHVLAAAGRLQGDADALRRARSFFAAERLPFGQMMF